MLANHITLHSVENIRTCKEIVIKCPSELYECNWTSRGASLSAKLLNGNRSLFYNGERSSSSSMIWLAIRARRGRIEILQYIYSTFFYSTFYSTFSMLNVKC
ncbi:hypothetical protein Y032_0231g3007 [Ancylostoma ceylanicum]|uniref:Uncharacterized protein n=1 Tax=Ancylostoma ceylanicum TaxID=53326 RepID=A0A016SFW6_9BILA|nr:hypothetical protein Y032_0231g3007 [Ancylostoma ceylanicum]